MTEQNNSTFSSKFIEYIKYIIPGAKEASGGTEIVCHCKYCPDSKDPNHGHMYIKVPQNSSDPILFYCFKCHTSGIVDSRTLIEWGIYDPIIGVELDKINKVAIQNRKYCGYNRDRFPFFNHVDNLKLAEMKLKYINDRLGLNLSLKECLSQKIIFNLKEVIDFNKVELYTRHPSIVDQLTENFIGFLSLDNNFVNMRRLCDEGVVYKSIDRRYINYNIHDKKDNTEKMYILPTIINLTKPQKVDIHIAEGPFDILSIKYNLRPTSQGIFAAVTGSGYKGLLVHLINLFQIFYFDLHIYPDNDKFGDRNMISELYNIVKPYGAVLYEHRNTFPGEKDFGVSMTRIAEHISVYT